MIKQHLNMYGWSMIKVPTGSLIRRGAQNTIRKRQIQNTPNMQRFGQLMGANRLMSLTLLPVTRATHPAGSGHTAIASVPGFGGLCLISEYNGVSRRARRRTAMVIRDEVFV